MILGPEGYSNSTLKSIGAIVHGKKTVLIRHWIRFHAECR